MSKIKVGVLAKELKIEVKDLVKALKDLGIVVKTSASSIDDDTVAVIKDLLNPKPKPIPTPAAPVPAVPAPEPEIVKEIPLAAPAIKKSSAIIIESEDISVKDLADKLNLRNADIIKELMKKGIMANLNQRINSEIAKEIGTVLGKEVEIIIAKHKAAVAQNIKADNLIIRPPVVTVMGHVDHGKTKLLDAIRKTKVAEGEAGGITQHIGAYQVEVHGKKVTFLDTPGHAAFTSLRARGAKITDITVLVVAADDGVMPQTIEAIDHSKAAGVPIMVAINKIDKPDSNPDKVKQQLSDLGLVPEDWGGKTIMVPTSARQGQGINELLEMILLLAEVQELKADPKGTISGVVIEAKIETGRGPVANILIKNGTLKVGDNFVIGSTYGKVRALFNDLGKRIHEAGPSTPVAVLGCVDVPKAGDLLESVNSEKEARNLAQANSGSTLKTARGKVISLEDYSKQVKEGDIITLPLVVKADVQGSIDAIVKSLQEMTVENVRVNIVHSGVGQINESDVMLASASKAIILGFNASAEGSAKELSEHEGIEVREYNIIYKLIDDVQLAMEGLLEPEYEEAVLGHAQVRNIFKFSKVGVIAGCFVTDGTIVRGAKIRVFRDKEKVYEGKLESLKRFKDDVKTVEQSFECGISVSGFNDFKVGDMIENFELREKSRKK